jgi:hypothetical protein
MPSRLRPPGATGKKGRRITPPPKMLQQGIPGALKPRARAPDFRPVVVSFDAIRNCISSPIRMAPIATSSPRLPPLARYSVKSLACSMPNPSRSNCGCRPTRCRKRKGGEGLSAPLKRQRSLLAPGAPPGCDRREPGLLFSAGFQNETFFWKAILLSQAPARRSCDVLDFGPLLGA